MIKRQWWLLWAAVLVTGCGDGGIQSPDFTPVLQSISVAPATADVELGQTQQFTASGTFTTPPGSASATVVRPLSNVAWSVSDTQRATIDENGLATTLALGTVTVSAQKDGVEGQATLNIVTGDLVEVRVTANPETTDPLPLNGSREYIARGIYTNSPRDDNGDPIPGPINGPVSWTSSNTGVATVTPPTGAKTTVKAQSTGTTTISASSPNKAGTPVTGSVDVEVEQALINGVVAVVPADATVKVGNTQSFVANAEFSNGTTGQVSNDQLDWTSAAPATATVNVDGVATGVAVGSTVITATLKAGVPSNTANRSASADLEVTNPGTDCSRPLNGADGATVSSATSALCVLCNVDDESNVIDANPDNFAKINVPVGLLLADASIRVKAPPGDPIQAGERAGFILGRPAGTLNPLGPVATLELLSSLDVRTYLGGTLTGDTSGASNSLTLSLLGTTAIDGAPSYDDDQVLVSIATTKPYDAIELVFTSGIVSAFAETNVYSAVCGELAPAP